MDRRKGYTLKRMAPPKPKANAFLRQVKALVAGKKKDAADVVRSTVNQTATTISCLTSSTDFATAASGTGLLDMDGDSALINTVRILQRIQLTCIEDLTPVGLSDAQYRTIIVWFYKPLLVASAAGTLPPITEVLVSDNLISLVVQDTANAGRFKILYDQTDKLGTNTVAVAASGADARLNGPITINREFVVPVAKTCHFKAPVLSGTASGQYDDNVSAGQVDKGLLVMYTLQSGGGVSEASA